MFPNATSAPTLRSTVASAVISASAGAAFHTASVRILARRRPRYRCASLLTAEAEQTVLVVAADEVVWEADVRNGLAAPVLSVAGFGLVHAGLGGRRVVAHMMVLAVPARAVQAWGGVPASICFHGGYNLSHLCDEARPR